MSANFANISLYIPHVFANINRKRVADTFETLRIGNVKRVDIVSKRSSNGECYNTVYIHFNYWYDNIASRNFQERVIDPNMEARIVYDEPWYWIVLENKSDKVKSNERKPRVNLDALNSSQIASQDVNKPMMTNEDFAKLVSSPVKSYSETQEDFFFEASFKPLTRSISSEFCYTQKDAAIITIDELIQENRNLKAQLGEYMEKAGRLEHEFNMLMDDKICVSNELALLKENQVYNNL